MKRLTLLEAAREVAAEIYGPVSNLYSKAMALSYRAKKYPSVMGHVIEHRVGKGVNYYVDNLENIRSALREIAIHRSRPRRYATTDGSAIGAIMHVLREDLMHECSREELSLEAHLFLKKYANDKIVEESVFREETLKGVVYHAKDSERLRERAKFLLKREDLIRDLAATRAGRK